MSKAIEMIARAKKIGKYIVENKATITQTAKAFGISTKTVRRSLDEWLRYVDRNLYEEAQKILDSNVSKKKKQ